MGRKSLWRVTTSVILLSICPQLLGQETNTFSENDPVDKFPVSMAAITLNNKKLKAEGVDLEVSVAYCASGAAL